MLSINVRKKLVPDPATGSGTPTMTHHDEEAGLVVAAVNEAVAKIPFMLTPNPAAQAFLRTHKNVPPAFIEAIADEVSARRQVHALQTIDVEAARHVVQYAAAYSRVARLFTDLGVAMQFSINSMLANIGADALDAYAVLKALAQTAGNEDLMQAVIKLQRELGRTRPKKRVKKVEPVPVVTKPPVTQPVLEEEEVKKAA